MQSVLRLGVSMRCTGSVDRMEPQAIDRDKDFLRATLPAKRDTKFPSRSPWVVGRGGEVFNWIIADATSKTTYCLPLPSTVH